MTQTTPRTFRLLRCAAAALLATALAGCIKLDMDLSIEGETISGTMITAIDQQAAQMFEMSPEDIFSTEGDDLSTIDGITAEPYETEQWVGLEYAFDQVSIEDFGTISNDATAPQISYDADAGRYEFTMVMDTSDELDDLEGEELGGEELEIPGFDPEALRESFEVTVAVTFPGEVTEHNGELSGTTVTWNPQLGETTEMRAVALASGAAGDGPAAGAEEDPAGGPADDPDGRNEAGQPGSGIDARQTGSSSSTSTRNALLVALAVLVVGTAGGVSAWLMWRRRQPAPAGADAGRVSDTLVDPNSADADPTQPPTTAQ